MVKLMDTILIDCLIIDDDAIWISDGSSLDRIIGVRSPIKLI